MNIRREGVETRRAAPKADAFTGERQGEGIVQTTNLPDRANAQGKAAKAVVGTKIRRAARPVPVRFRPPAPGLVYVAYRREAHVAVFVLCFRLSLV